MGISIFPSTAAEFVSNNFVVDMNDTNNNTVTLANTKQAGTYNISLDSGDSTFDIYLLDGDGALVAYSNSTTIAPANLFETVVILGVSSSELVSFSYAGAVSNADGEGNQPGAGAYLESITPSDLPSIDDTATVVGGNFGANTEITFESGATVLDAKSITVVSGTELLVTRPDGLIEDDAPYDLKAINPGVTPPSSIPFVLTDAVTAGSDPTWVTTSPLDNASPGVAFSQQLTATDVEGQVVDYSIVSGSIAAGLTLNSSNGVLSGTPTEGGSFTFTVRATDDGGNSTDKQFEQSVIVASGGTETTDGTYTYHTFTSTDTFEVFADIAGAEYVVIAGGGGGGGSFGNDTGRNGGGGGGAGGLLNGTQTITAGTYTITVGAGGATFSNGSDSSIGNILTATGGGAGQRQADGADGGSGAGGDVISDTGGEKLGGSGIAGQGHDGADSWGDSQQNEFPKISGGGGGGGAGGPGIKQTRDSDVSGGPGLLLSDWASATGTGESGYYAGGGGGGRGINNNVAPLNRPDGGIGGGADGADRMGNAGINANSALASTGGGGGGGAYQQGRQLGSAGASGLVMVRYQL